MKDFYARLLKGSLVAAGRRGDPAAALTIIPSDAWKYLRLEAVSYQAWSRKEILFYGVRILRLAKFLYPAIAPNLNVRNG